MNQTNNLNEKKPKKEVLIGVCGGVGPAAGILLHQNILKYTENNGTDQGHLNVCHLSRSMDTTDRTNFLLNNQSNNQNNIGANPAEGMARTFQMLKEAADSRKASVVVGVPCNTFHAKAIWSEFLRLTNEKNEPNVTVLHMLEETAQMIPVVAPKAKIIGLMSTTGTRKCRVYRDLLEPLGYTVVEVSENMQEELHETIYDTEYGIKSTSPMVHPKAVANFEKYALDLARKGAEVLILGCTEIPFAFAGKTEIFGAQLVDPLVALSRAMIREADQKRLKPLPVAKTTKKTKKVRSNSLLKKFVSNLSMSEGHSDNKSNCCSSSSTSSEFGDADCSTDVDTDSEYEMFSNNKKLTKGNPLSNSTSSIWKFYNEYVEQYFNDDVVYP